MPCSSLPLKRSSRSALIGSLLLLSLTLPVVGAAQGPPPWLWKASGSDPANAVGFSADGTAFAKGTTGSDVLVFDSIEGSPSQVLSGHTGQVLAIAFPNSGDVVATGSFDRSVRLWNWRTGALIRSLPGHSAPVNAIAFSPNGNLLASASTDRTVRIWRVGDGALLNTLTGHTDAVNSLAWGSSNVLASGSSDLSIRLWDPATGILLRTLTGHAGPISSLAFNTDLSQLASGSWDATVKLWNPQTGDLFRTIPGHTDWVLGLVFTGDRRTLVSGSLDGTIRFWNPQDGTLRKRYDEETGAVLGLAFGFDDALLGIAAEQSGVARNPFGVPDVQFPIAFQALRGRVDRGDLTSLRGDDSNPLRVCRFIVPNDPLRVVELRYTLRTITPKPGALVVAVRSRASVGGLLQQTLELFDWAENRFDPTDVLQGNLNTTFTSRVLTATGDLTRYVDSNRRIRVQQTMRIVGPIPNPNPCLETTLVRATVTPS